MLGTYFILGTVYSKKMGFFPRLLASPGCCQLGEADRQTDTSLPMVSTVG